MRVGRRLFGDVETQHEEIAAFLAFDAEAERGGVGHGPSSITG
jgi:hypothetical protein